MKALKKLKARQREHRWASKISDKALDRLCEAINHPDLEKEVDDHIHAFFDCRNEPVPEYGWTRAEADYEGDYITRIARMDRDDLTFDEAHELNGELWGYLRKHLPHILWYNFTPTITGRLPERS